MPTLTCCGASFNVTTQSYYTAIKLQGHSNHGRGQYALLNLSNCHMGGCNEKDTPLFLQSTGQGSDSIMVKTCSVKQDGIHSSIKISEKKGAELSPLTQAQQAQMEQVKEDKQKSVAEYQAKQANGGGWFRGIFG
jgi:hypothetical protein